MKKVFFVTAVLTAVIIGLTGCDQPGNPKAKSGDGGGNTSIVPSVSQSELYGSYWGQAKVAGEKYDMCIVVKADKAELHSDMMGFTYEVVTYKDEGNGRWAVGCYHKGEDTSKPSTHVRLKINTTKTPFSCKPNIIPMGAIAQFLYCNKGEDYDGRYKY